MAWSIIRRADSSDATRLIRAAERFIDRHQIRDHISPDPNDPYDVVHELDFYIQSLVEHPHWYEHGKYLNKLWVAARRRALRHRWAEGIVQNYVGFHTS